MPGRSSGRNRPPSLTIVGRDSDVAFYLNKVAPGGPVLVLGCGDGRVTWELCIRGLPVVAVDPSPVMIASVDERRKTENAEASDRLRLVGADLRSLRLNERFATVIAPQNALGLLNSLADLEATFVTARQHLSPSGIFIFDAANPQRRPLAPPDRFLEPEHFEPPRPLFAPHMRERRRDPKGDSAALRRLRLRLFSPAEIDASLVHAGLVATEKFGQFDGKPFDPTDPLQIVIASLG
jgi:SAM-dependent methyltransferase